MAEKKTTNTTRPWNDVKADLDPNVRADADALLKKDLQRMLLSEIRKMAGMTQHDLAQALGVSQAHISKIEKQDNVQLDTLRRIVEALGGELEVSVKLPTGRITISQFGQKTAA